MELNQKIAGIIQNNGSQISTQVVNRIYSERSEEWKRYGDEGKALSIRDTSYHLPYLTEALKSKDPTVFTDYIQWVQSLFTNLHLPADTLELTLRHMKKVISTYLDNEMTTVVDPVFQNAMKVLKQPLKSEVTFLEENKPYAQVLKTYFKSLIAGDRLGARKVILEAVESGVPVKDIYMHVFQPSQYEIGRLWQANEISVAKEHFVSAATQQIMAQLYPRIFSSQRNGKVMVAANVGGDLHEMGIRMVADFFEMEGWDTYYLGANTPLKSLLDASKEYKPDLVALSAAMPFYRTSVKEFVMKVKEAAPHIKVMIGGRAIKSGNEELNWFGADGYAKDAPQAVEMAERLVK